jgi:hypothetical protein
MSKQVEVIIWCGIKNPISCVTSHHVEGCPPSKETQKGAMMGDSKNARTRLPNEYRNELPLECGVSG